MKFAKYFFLVWISVLPLASYKLWAHYAAHPSAEKITLDFKKISVRELLQFIAESMHCNIIMSESVTGNLALHLNQVTWGQALELVLEMCGFVKKQTENNLLIGTPSEFAARQKSLSEASPTKIAKIKFYHTDAGLIHNIIKAEPDLLSPIAKLSFNPNENSVLIKENTENLALIENYLRHLDVPEKQVQVAAKILNVDDDKLNQLGIHFEQNQRSNERGNLHVSFPEQTSNALSIAIASVAQSQLLNLQLELLQTTGHSKIIANPHIVTQNRKTAIIEAGEEIPYQESTSSGATSVSFKKAALSLKVTPTVLPDARIMLMLEISQNKTSPLAVNGTPAIQTQELRTEVVVSDNQTVILGGIFEQFNSTVTQAIPVISQIPLLGTLFTRKEARRARKELLIFLSPHILKKEDIP